MSAEQAASMRGSARRIMALAWPVFIGQLSVVGFSTVDTFFTARHSALDLAALSVGATAYITVFIGLMGMVLALGPIVGQHFGAKRLVQAGEQLHQAVWVALVLAMVGSTVLVFPQPFLAMADVSPELEPKVRHYLLALAFSLPASLLFAAFRGFNNAVSRQRAVMVLQVAAFGIKLPLSAWLIGGGGGFEGLGVVGGGISTAVAMWAQAGAALWVLRRDRFYEPFQLRGQGLRRPNRQAIAEQLRLGVPMGLAVLVEVTGFSFMALFIARLGHTEVAGHQIAANLVSMMFMLPMAVASATTTLVAQRIGAQDMADARRMGWHGLRLGLVLAAAMGTAVFFARGPIVALYTPDAAVAAACLPLLAWVVMFHLADAAQILATFVLRAHRVATAPLFILAGSLWGVGLGGGWLVGYNKLGITPPALQGAPGFWAMCTLGLWVASASLIALQAWVSSPRRGG